MERIMLFMLSAFMMVMLPSCVYPNPNCEHVIKVIDRKGDPVKDAIVLRRQHRITIGLLYLQTRRDNVYAMGVTDRKGLCYFTSANSTFLSDSENVGYNAYSPNLKRRSEYGHNICYTKNNTFKLPEKINLVVTLTEESKSQGIMDFLEIYPKSKFLDERSRIICTQAYERFYGSKQPVR